MYIAESTDTPCQQRDAKLWFSKLNTRGAERAKGLCYECPERRKCLDSAVRFERKQGFTDRGIYGGLDTAERAVFLELPVAVSA
jgi:protein-arginine kinase activator protein McsA